MRNADLMIAFFCRLVKSLCVLIGSPDNPLFYFYGIILGIGVVFFLKILRSSL